MCQLYGYQTRSVEEARYWHVRKTCKIDKSLLPLPDLDGLRQHTLRANFQAAIWRRATTAVTAPPDPTSSGWQLIDNHLSPRWTINPPVPDSLKEKFNRCACKKNMCETSRCSCRANDLVCTELCLCSGCLNDDAQPNFSEDDSESDSEEDDLN